MTKSPPLKNKIQKIGIITKENLIPKLGFLKETIDYLKKEKKEIFCDAHVAKFMEAPESYSVHQILQHCDLVLVLGGDGTLLKTAGLTLPKKTLILGVNLGNLGFLTATTPLKLLEHLKKIFQQEYIVDERTLLRVTLYREGKKFDTFLALNDAVMNQGSFARLIEMELKINQKRVIKLKADGLIMSSPTGSTGHSLSAGGPIVHPSLPALIVTPICPATLSIRPIILPNNRQVSVILTTKRREDQTVGLTIDGQTTIALQYGDEIKMRKSSRVFYLVRIKGHHSYYHMLRTKLSWGSQPMKWNS